MYYAGPHLGSVGRDGLFDDDVPIAEQLDFLRDAVAGGGKSSSSGGGRSGSSSSGSVASGGAADGGVLTRSLSATRRHVTSSSDTKRAAERAAEQRFIKSAASVPLVPPKQQRLSKGATKKQQLRSMDPAATGRALANASTSKRSSPNAEAAGRGGRGEASGRRHVVAPKVTAALARQQERVAAAPQKRAKAFDAFQ